MDALWTDTPSGVIFFVEGAGQGGVANWGSGFTTDKAVIAVNDFSGGGGQSGGVGTVPRGFRTAPRWAPLSRLPAGRADA